MKTLIALAFALVLLFTTGCTTTEQQQLLNVTAQIIAKDATYFTLREKPELRDEFERALFELNEIAIAENINFSHVVALVQRLPVDELRSDDARIIASDVLIIVNGFAPNQGEIISPERLDRIRAFVVALRDGVKIGLSQSRPEPQ
jgi:hypothetical protein